MSSNRHNAYMFALAFASVSIAAGAAAVFQVPMKATLLAPTAALPSPTSLPATPPAECGAYQNNDTLNAPPYCGGACPSGQVCVQGNQPFGNACICDDIAPTPPPSPTTLPATPPAECGAYQEPNNPNPSPVCGGACGFGQICQTGTQPFGRDCICAPDPALPTTPPALCGAYAPAGAEFPSCGGTCPFGQVCQKGQPFGGNLCTCGADPTLPTTPPVNCGPFQNGNSPAYQCGGACPAGATCKIGQPFGSDCLCVSTANGNSTSLPRMGN